jgi:hypothetical protein
MPPGARLLPGGLTLEEVKAAEVQCACLRVLGHLLEVKVVQLVLRATACDMGQGQNTHRLNKQSVNCLCFVRTTPVSGVVLSASTVN